MGQTLLIVLKPLANAEQLTAVRAGVKALRAQGHEVTVRQTFEEGDGERFAGEGAAAGVDVVVAAGGDGTINEVVNGLAKGSGSPRFAVVPLGTANDFSWGLDLPADAAGALEIAVNGQVREVDLARVNDRHFINVSTGGFGAEATEQAATESKRLLGAWAYLVTGARQFGDLQPVRGVITTDGAAVFEGEFLLFAIGNARRTGGGTMLTPRAELDDGLLDLLVVRAIPRIDFLALLPDLRAGTHLESPDILYAQAPSFTVSTERPLSVNADGEPIGGSRFEYRLAARRVSLMVP